MESYEKKYKEALERAKSWAKGEHPECFSEAQKAVDFIFPELKESEDERIRKVLIKGFQHYDKECKWGEFTTTEILAWLEKQGVQKSNKVEPKFEAGDWIISPGGCYLHILDIEKDGYLCEDIIGEEVNVLCEHSDCDFKLWTIQDAKEGDVLATKIGYPFIYDKNRYNNGLAYYYVGLDVNKELTLKSPHQMLAHFGELRSVSPATKEQRDLLFQKMKEAGYVWDAEKKELRKIEQNLAWNGEDEAGFGNALWAIEQARSIAKDENDMGNLWYAERWLKSLKERMKGE